VPFSLAFKLTSDAHDLLTETHVQHIKKTRFSFNIQYIAGSTTPKVERDQRMNDLGPKRQALLTMNDAHAQVITSNSQRGNENKIVDLISAQSDAQIAALLTAFCALHGVVVTAVD
jgi:hypothetical protein